MKSLLAILRFFLARRYKVTIKGAEILSSKNAKIILPNHQAHVDPQIAAAYIFKYTKVSPVVTERFYNSSILKPLFKKIGAVPVSDLTAGNRDVTVLNTIYSNVIKSLENGNNVLLYPAGQIMGQGYEKIFNKQSAYQIVKNLPENSQVIGMRINGLWGSMWSKAWMGKSPSFFPTLLKAIFYLIANLLFFVPKRTVKLEFVDITSSAKIQAEESKQIFNNFLEKFYNVDGEEEVRYIKHFVYGPKLKKHLPAQIDGSVKDVKNVTTLKDSDIPVDIFNTVCEIIIKEAELKETSLKISQNLSLDLGVDSLGLVTIVEAIENKYRNAIPPDITIVKTVGDLCHIAMGKGVVKEILKDSFLTKQIQPTKRIHIDPSKNIVELFLETFKGGKNEPFAYDKTVGCTTRKEFMLKAMVVSKVIKKEVSGKRVGIMLPALQSTALLVTATYLAGKVPVMLNWTMGKKVLNQCVNNSKVNHILTATAFFEKVEETLSEEVKEKCIFFEKKAAAMSLGTKLSGLLSFYITPKFKIKQDDVAVVLFTSGSESQPKAVELTHKNLIANLHGVCESVELYTDQIFLGFLPPFHSFGFTVLTIFPLITGMKIAYSPNPTSSNELVNILRHTSANTLLATPTFLKLMLSHADKDDMQTVKLAITGAESLHPSIINQFYEKVSPEAKILEGYGITECSPAISINPRHLQKSKSVGQFITGIKHLIVDISTNTPLEKNTEGMILVKGDSIFNGYVDPNIDSPFVSVNNEVYYKTGDLGYVDEDGYVFITGRLKRFIKIAGEMISLPAIEASLLEKYGSQEELKLAVEGSDQIEPPQIALFSIDKLDIAEVNTYLREQGFSSLIKIHQLQQVTEIPILGTGKTDYKVLKQKIE